MRIRDEYLILIASLIVFIDRILKIYLKDGCISEFCIKRALNSGAAFGIFPGAVNFFIIVSIIVLVLIAYFWKIKKIRFSLTLIAAGTIGNLIDRLFYGHVIDLFSLFGSSSFNLSDVSNVLGALFLVIFIFKRESK